MLTQVIRPHSLTLVLGCWLNSYEIGGIQSRELSILGKSADLAQMLTGKSRTPDTGVQICGKWLTFSEIQWF